MDSAEVRPFVIDPTGRDVLGEADRVRGLGPVALVELPGGVRAWAATDQSPAPSPHAASPRCGRVSRRSPATCSTRWPTCPRTGPVDLRDVLFNIGKAPEDTRAAFPLVYGPNAGRFDAARADKEQHLAFGYGAHHCLGAPLARLKAAIALPARYPDLTLDVEPGDLLPLQSFVSNGYRALPARLTR